MLKSLIVILSVLLFVATPTNNNNIRKYTSIKDKQEAIQVTCIANFYKHHKRMKEKGLCFCDLLTECSSCVTWAKAGILFDSSEAGTSITALVSHTYVLFIFTALTDVS